jgi:hypothetical protein
MCVKMKDKCKILHHCHVIVLHYKNCVLLKLVYIFFFLSSITIHNLRVLY